MIRRGQSSFKILVACRAKFDFKLLDKVMNQFFSMSDCARLLEVAEHKIVYAHRCGKLPEPKFRLSNRRAYTKNELEAMAAYFGRRAEEIDEELEDD